MRTPRLTRLYRWDDVPREQLSEKHSRRFVTGEKVMIAQVYLNKGCVVPMHTHESEQLSYVLEGALRMSFETGEPAVVVHAGEVLHVPSNVAHEAEALEETLDVDIFSPPRQEWIQKADPERPR